MNIEEIAKKVASSNSFTDSFKLTALKDLLQMQGVSKEDSLGGKLKIYSTMIEQRCYETKWKALLLSVRFVMERTITESAIIFKCTRREAGASFSEQNLNNIETVIDAYLKLGIPLYFVLAAEPEPHTIQWYDPIEDHISIRWADGGYTVTKYDEREWGKVWPTTPQNLMK